MSREAGGGGAERGFVRRRGRLTLAEDAAREAAAEALSQQHARVRVLLPRRAAPCEQRVNERVLLRRRFRAESGADTHDALDAWGASIGRGDRDRRHCTCEEEELARHFIVRARGARGPNSRNCDDK